MGIILDGEGNEQEFDLVDPELPEHLQGKVNFNTQMAMEVFKRAGLTQDQVDILWPAFTANFTEQIGQVHQQFTEQIQIVKAEASKEAIDKGREAGKAEALSVMTPQDAAIALQKIWRDPTHPLNDFKASPELHEMAVAEQVRLLKIRSGLSDNMDGFLEEYRGTPNPMKEIGTGDVANRKSSNGVMRGDNDSNQPNNDAPVQDGKARSSASGRSISDIEPAA